MNNYSDQEIYNTINPAQRAELDAINASTNRWKFAKKAAIVFIVALVATLFIAS